MICFVSLLGGGRLGDLLFAIIYLFESTQQNDKTTTTTTANPENIFSCSVHRGAGEDGARAIHAFGVVLAGAMATHLNGCVRARG